MLLSPEVPCLTGRSLRPFAAFCVLLFLGSTALAADFTGCVVGVADGDTITVLHNGKGERIRLHGIDCPEKRQAFGNRAKQFTSTLVFGKTVTVQILDRDRYGRTVGVVLLPDGRSLNHELVRAGLAWMYRRYTNDQSLSDLEEQARVARRQAKTGQ